MKIEFIKASSAYNTQAAQNTQAVDSAKSKAAKKAGAASTNNQDRIELSPRAKKLTSEWPGKISVKNEIMKTDEAKLERLSTLIARGEYRVSSEEIADAILGKRK